MTAQPDNSVAGTEETRNMAEGERSTGTPNKIYDLSSVLFHALEGGASYDTYIEDAEREGDQELARFFRQVRDEDSNRADRAQQLLAERSLTAARNPEGTVPPRSEEVPPPEEVPSGIQQAPPEDVAWPVPGEIPHEDMIPPTPPPPRGRPGDEQRRAMEQEDRGLVDEVLDKVDRALGRDERGKEGPDREDRR